MKKEESDDKENVSQPVAPIPVAPQSFLETSPIAQSTFHLTQS